MLPPAWAGSDLVAELQAFKHKKFSRKIHLTSASTFYFLKRAGPLLKVTSGQKARMRAFLESEAGPTDWPRGQREAWNAHALQDNVGTAHRGTPGAHVRERVPWVLNSNGSVCNILILDSRAHSPLSPRALEHGHVSVNLSPVSEPPAQSSLPRVEQRQMWCGTTTVFRTVPLR